MVSVVLYLEYYHPTKLHQIAEDWRDLGKHNEENAPDIIFQTMCVVGEIRLSSFKVLYYSCFNVKSDSKEKYHKLFLYVMIMK